MFITVFRVAGKGEVYDDKVVLLTEDLVKAVNTARAYEPFGWRSPELGGQSAHRAYVFRAVPEEADISGPVLVYARQIRKRGRRMGWEEFWGLPMWKKAYDRQVREAVWVEKRRQREAHQEASRPFRKINRFIRKMRLLGKANWHKTSEAAK